MHVQLELGHSRRDIEITVHHPDATVADLLDAIDPGSGASWLLVEDRVVPARQRLDRAGIVPGATIRPSTDDRPPLPAAERCAEHAPVVVVHSIAGLDAGRSWALAPGRHLVGRTDASGRPISAPVIDLADRTVSSSHAELEVDARGRVRVADLGSRNGTWLDDRPCGRTPDAVDPDQRVRCGASVLATSAAPMLGTPAIGAPPALLRSGARPFHRPPRPGPAPDTDPIDPPQAPTASSGASPIGIVSVVVPIVLGLVMVRVLGSWTYALFMLLSPVMLIGTALEQRRRGRRTRRRDAAAFRRALDDLATAVEHARRDGARRLWARLPGVASATERAASSSPQLWERRPHHADAFVVSVGLGPVAWSPPVRGDRHEWAPEVLDLVNRGGTLRDAPVEIDLSPGEVVGVAGTGSAALSVIRSLIVQIATLHGPADLLVATFAGDHASADWDWVKWFPHTAATTALAGRPAVAFGDVETDQLVSALVTSRRRSSASAATPTGGQPAAEPLILLVMDARAGSASVSALAQKLLRGGAGPVTAVVVTDGPDRLPVATSTVVALDGQDGAAVVHHLDPAVVVPDVHAAGVSLAVAERAARALAAHTDPEAAPGAGLPTMVELAPLLGLSPPSDLALRARWAGAGDDPAPVAVLGMATDGPVVIDLERDGPHALIAGTTGSGKSELLRTLVASLAASSSPEHLTFVLIDFKGGSAFADCARLPHTVGFVTDLDDHLAARALRCLEAELRHRERVLAAAGVADLHELRRRGADAAALPRLVVVIDEFATLAAELPDFVEALVGIAQRGRSLGVHLVLATQRPAGVVSANIQANTDLRIALRVQAPDESNDVVGTPAAASLARGTQGRAIVRRGPGDLVTMQTALVSGSGRGSRRPVDLRPFTVLPTAAAGRTDDERTSDLAVFVEAVLHAHAAGGRGPLRTPWPPPLPSSLDVDDLPAPATGSVDLVPLGLADLPDDQRQQVFGWRPADGGLLVVGVGGAGTTTAAQSAVLASARAHPAADLHVYVLDYGHGDHDALAVLPHVGAVVRAGDTERQRRALRLVEAELARRRHDLARRSGAPRVILVVDGLSGFRAELDDAPDGWLDLLARVVADGPPVGITTIITADRAGAVPPALAALLTQRLVLRLGDRNEHAALGVAPSEVPSLPPGRGHLPDGPTLVQVARASDLTTVVDEILRRHPEPDLADRPPPVGVLPDSVGVASLWSAGRPGTACHPWRLPIAVAESDLGPASLVLHDADHALVAGPARSGRTTALCTIADAAIAGDEAIHVVAVAGRRSTLLDHPGVHRRVDHADVDVAFVRDLAGHDGPVVVLVDDAERTPDDGAFADLVSSGRPDLHVIAAGRAEPLRQTFAHWTRAVRASRTGLLLQPDVDLDGDLLGCHLPRRAAVPVGRGRGWLVADGDARLVQVALPSRQDRPAA